MPKYRWAPPEHPDPPEDQPLGIDADPTAVDIPGYPPVTVTVDFTRTGRHKLPGFVEKGSAEHVYVQLVHMGFSHHVWLPRPLCTHRTFKPRGRS